jgi:hypothetical protein
MIIEDLFEDDIDYTCMDDVPHTDHSEWNYYFSDDETLDDESFEGEWLAA